VTIFGGGSEYLLNASESYGQTVQQDFRVQVQLSTQSHAQQYDTSFIYKNDA
jgi:hypothetical protein